jgi:glutamine synthetase
MDLDEAEAPSVPWHVASEGRRGAMSGLDEISVGKVGFIDQHGLWTAEQAEAAERVKAQIDEHALTTVRISWGDQHGILRGKTLITHDFLLALRNGQDFQSFTLVADTANNPSIPIWTKGVGLGIDALTGLPDVILVPDPTTFRILPWAPNTGWVLGDMYFSNGEPVPFSTRQVMRTTLEDLRAEGYEYVAGLEVEFYVTRIEDPMLQPEQAGWPPTPPRVAAIAHGFQYLTEHRNDEIDDVLQLLRENLVGVGLPLRTMEDEWGPGQCEFTFDPRVGVEAADNMLLFRGTVKQVCRRNGYHATFMTRPALPNFFSSGWHLHQSLRDIKTGQNAFTNRTPAQEPLSEPGQHFLGGILEHALAASVFSTPTINGYKRFRPDSFAPDRVTWARENRAAFIRVIGGPEDETTHLENRAGEPCANPYLFMASQVVCGLDGIRSKIEPGPPDEEPYSSEKPLLPRSLMESVAALEASELFKAAFGAEFVDYILKIKRSEIGRFLSHVTDWEQTEYFELL